ncbi:putative Late nodulin [Medicago truncatula]|uniref:Late nodulin n=1 Tax=Medicago truncatula TaxID=3880 RepID=A0A072UPM6_MEDTR|nr:late nodulin [Medicago truncatula]RHN62347.1 putative Late nodulin [Medicago truncatula]
MGETLKFVYTMSIFLSLFLVVTSIVGEEWNSHSWNSEFYLKKSCSSDFDCPRTMCIKLSLARCFNDFCHCY